MADQKLRMNNRKFTILWTAILAVLLVLIVSVTVVMNFFSLSMEIFLGRGEPIKTKTQDTSGWNTEYITKQYKDGDELMALTQATALKIAEEGEVLLKNDGVLPLSKGQKVTPFGYRYLKPVYGGTGSGNVNPNSQFIISAQKALAEVFTVNADVEKALAGAGARGMTADGFVGADEKGGFEGAGQKIIEVDPKVYGGHEASCSGTTAIVFIGRVGGEGSDIQANVEGSAIYQKGYKDGTAHQLQLSEAEKATIRFAKAHCEKTVVIINSANVMEIRDLLAKTGELSVDAVLWLGDPGGQGFKAMAEILTGEVNPSGKTVDTWMTDIMADPTMANFGNFKYTNLQLVKGGYPTPVGDPAAMDTLEYEENIYLGYRYYETVAATGGTFRVFGQDGQSYEQAVQVPFGFGLSYGTDFSQKITNFVADGKTISVTVRVTNGGTRAGKDVVQLYSNPPYTAYDIQAKIEKSTANLVAFSKTPDIEPGKSQDVVVTFAKEALASYSYTRHNPDGTLGAYLLENGGYTISANKNAHEAYDSKVFKVDADVWYDASNPRQSEIDAQSVLDNQGKPTNIPATTVAGTKGKFLAASNLFQDLTDHMAKTSQLTRAHGALINTATSPTAEERVAPAGTGTANGSLMTMAQMDLATNPVLGNVEGSKVFTTTMPKTGAKNGLSLSTLRGRAYDDPLWDELLDQLDLSEQGLYVALAASYDQTAGIQSISKPATVDYDGPQGIVGSITDHFEYTAYPCEPIIAATFNTALAYDLGKVVGQEAISAKVNSWYAPAMNLHRSPFSGRNFEYYSEDPVLSGSMAAHEVSGASDQGLITTIKHFALNDEELYTNDRSRVTVWANEQAMRELYLKPFELAVKDARMTLRYVSDNKGTVAEKVTRGATGVMGSMNYLGFTWSGANYALNTALLRDEWGFRGLLITDMVMNAGSNSVDQALRSGSDTWMAWGNAFTTLIHDKASATGVSTIRRAVKDMSYAIVNSRAMNGVAPGTIIAYQTSPWIIWLTVANVVVYAFLVTMVVVLVLRTRDAKRRPEAYRN